jgi:hypothetical protein
MDRTKHIFILRQVIFILHQVGYFQIFDAILHFVVLSAMGKDLRVEHSPPLLFQIDTDPAERYPLNTSASTELTEVLLAIENAATVHAGGLEWTYGDGRTQAIDPKYLPCCNRTLGCRCSIPNGV